MPKRTRLTSAAAALRKHALSYPGTTEAFPWGHSAFKINGKTFLFAAIEENELRLSMKLPETGKVALALPFAASTGYGLGKSGWVTARFDTTSVIPLDMLREWIDESFRAIAPKRVLAALATMEADRPSTARPRKRSN